jgi:hypothetical protein
MHCKAPIEDMSSPSLSLEYSRKEKEKVNTKKNININSISVLSHPTLLSIHPSRIYHA